MAIEVFNRYETKYFVREDQMPGILSQIERYMELDQYNPDRRLYTISNLYFDTEDDYLIRESLAKPVYKEKIRLRAYGVPEANGKAYLEIKKKVDGLVNKRRTKIGLQEAYRFIESGGKAVVTEGMNLQVLKELSYMAQHYKLYPKTAIAYDRLAYFEKENPDLRVSFDTNIRSRRGHLRLEEGNHGRLLLPRGQWLMEIKTAKAMPVWLAKLLAQERLFKSGFSKYGEEFKRYINSQEGRGAQYA